MPGCSGKQYALPFISLKSFYNWVKLENENELHVEKQYRHLKLVIKSVIWLL